ncbi:class I SAM-dependent methyltransferase [Actinospongicola halichondriae]|uniref:class I SAM-dependent methyltransferase n=1 Tax=Actinospongicola halichondriae TaxID=3236844 RepID=UPI003D4D4311
MGKDWARPVKAIYSRIGRSRRELDRLRGRLAELGILEAIHDPGFPDLLAANHRLSLLESGELPDLLAANHELEFLKTRLESLGLEQMVHFATLPESAVAAIRWRPPGHFYSPIPDLDQVDLDALGVPSDGGPGLDLRPEGQREWFETLAPAIADWPFPTSETEGWRYFAPNGHFDLVDGAFLHAVLRQLRPRRMIEIGSGFSTALILDTIDRYLPGEVDFTAIEPFPEVLGERLRPEDTDSLRLLQTPVQDVDLAEFERLEAGDVLFIDSTHVVKSGSDVVHLFRHVVPSLAPGVIVHVHDMLWPFEYPRAWQEEGRVWTELQLVEAFLRFNDRFRILGMADWFHRHELAGIDGPAADVLRRGSGGGSLWLEVVP